MLDAPVSGGSEGAVAGTLTIMVGGEPGEVARAHDVLAAMGRTITHLGPIGSGQVAKAVNQVILCGTYLGVAEGIVLAIKAGMDPEAVVAALSGGAAGSWVLQNRSGRMIEDRYPLGFKIALHRKDMAIALELARSAGAVLPVASWPPPLRTASSPRVTVRTTTRRSPGLSVGSPACEDEQSARATREPHQSRCALVGRRLSAKRSMPGSEGLSKGCCLRRCALFRTGGLGRMHDHERGQLVTLAHRVVE